MQLSKILLCTAPTAPESGGLLNAHLVPIYGVGGEILGIMNIL